MTTPRGLSGSEADSDGDGAAAANYVSTRGSIATLSQRELAVISPLLVDGHRDDTGGRALFLGTVGEAWRAMDEAQRREAAESLRQKLADLGAHEVMLFDRIRGLQVHYVGLQNRYPGWARERP